MSDELVPGQSVSYTNPQGVTYRGVVEKPMGDWVMIELDEPCDTPQGWQTKKMMLKASALKSAS